MWHEVRKEGNVVVVVHSASVINRKPKSDATEYRFCAVCQEVTKKKEYGCFVNGRCSNCGANENGNGPLVVDFAGIVDREIEAMEKGEASPLDIQGAKSGTSHDNVRGKDGLMRKVFIRDEILAKNGVTSKYYKKLVYREILDDAEKPVGFDKKAKYKKLILVGFHDSPLTIEEIQLKINSAYILVVADDRE